MFANSRQKTALLSPLTLFLGFARARGWGQAPEAWRACSRRLPSQADVSWMSPLTHGHIVFSEPQLPHLPTGEGCKDAEGPPLCK